MERWFSSDHFISVQLLSRVQLFVTPWTAVRQASLSITNSWSLPKLMSIELVTPSNHLILCRPLLLSPSIFPSIRVFSNEYWSGVPSPSPSEYNTAIFYVHSSMANIVEWSSHVNIEILAIWTSSIYPCFVELFTFLVREENGNPFQYSCLGNPMDRGAWRDSICWVALSQNMVLGLNSGSSGFRIDLWRGVLKFDFYMTCSRCMFLSC